MTTAQKRERVRALAEAGKVHVSNLQIAKMSPGTLTAILQKFKDFDFKDSTAASITEAHGDPATHLDAVAAEVESFLDMIETPASKVEQVPDSIQSEIYAVDSEWDDAASSDPTGSSIEPVAGNGNGNYNSLLTIIDEGLKTLHDEEDPVEANDHMAFDLAVDTKLGLDTLRQRQEFLKEKVFKLYQQCENFDKDIQQIVLSHGAVQAKVNAHGTFISQLECLVKDLNTKVEKLIAAGSTAKIIVEHPDKQIVIGDCDDEIVHFQFKNVARILASRTHDGYPIPVWLWGAAGGGKTTLGEQLAKAFGVDFYQVSMGPSYTEHKLVGYVNQLSDKYVEGFIRPAFENGGLVLLDEADLTDAAVLAALNAALANKSYLFPDGKTVPRHKDFYVVAGANTLGNGERGGYKRNKLDAATLDRFIPYLLQYDHVLEKKLAQEFGWFAEWVWRVREFLNETETPGVLGTRAIVYGASLLKTHDPVEVKRFVLQRFPEDVIETILTDFQ